MASEVASIQDTASDGAAERFLSGGGETGTLIRAYDWSSTPLGPPASWPNSLKTAVSLMLGAGQPVYIAWGPGCISLYNDGYLSIVGTKHPGIGKPFEQLWAEIWDQFRPIVEKTLAGHAQYFVDMPIALAGRKGVPVGYFTFSYTPLRDDDGTIAGFYCAATETTERVLAEERLRQAEVQLRQQVDQLNALYDSAPIGLGFFDRNYRYLRVNEELALINGVPQADHIGRTIRQVLPVHAPTVEPIIDRIFASGESVRNLEVSGETPLQPGILRHWLTGFYPVKDPNGLVEAVGAWVIEISERKAAEERELLLAREVDHRAKNLLAVVQSVVHLTKVDNAAELKEAISGRIQSLARAHSLLAESRWDGAQLGALVREELAPYLASEGRVNVEGPTVVLRPAVAQSLAIVIHELATNAAKYGALSSAEGKLEVRWSSSGGLLELSWTESGGPPVGKPGRSGFGSKIIRSTIERQLQGKFVQTWEPTGLRCMIRFGSSDACSATA